MLTLLLPLLSSAADAAVVVRFCAKYQVDYVDATSSIGDDEFITNNNKLARGVTVRTIPNNGGLVLDWITEDLGTEAGCTPNMVLDENITYDVRIYSEASVNGVDLRVENSGGGLWYSVALDDWTPSAGDWDLPTAGTHYAWNMLAAAGYALAMHPAGIGNSGESITFSADNCPAWPAGTNCSYPDEIYLPTGNDEKYVIVHELGHSIGSKRDEGNLPQSVYDAPVGDCFTNASTDEDIWRENSKENQSAAAIEGLATFYAASIFNDDAPGDDCYIDVGWVDWDLDTFNDDESFPSCDLGPYGIGDPNPPAGGVDKFDYLGDYCLGTGATTNRATQWDYVRHFWDLKTATTITNLSVIEVYDIWDESNPKNWSPSGVGSGNGFPAHELQTAADNLGFGVRWGDMADLNGVDR